MYIKRRLNTLLKQFYIEVRKSDGNHYKKTSFNSIRFGLQQKLKECNPNLDIIADTEFTECNNIFKAQCVQLKKNGFSKIEHKPPITPEDIKNYTKVMFLVCQNQNRCKEKCSLKSCCFSAVAVGKIYEI